MWFDMFFSIIHRGFSHPMRLLLPQGFGPEGEIPRRHLSSSYEKYLKLKYTVSIPERISICFIDQGRIELLATLGNSDVSAVHACK